MLWFDVEIEGITTIKPVLNEARQLWFDVEIEGITTPLPDSHRPPQLWFDVEIEGITTRRSHHGMFTGCGLM